MPLMIQGYVDIDHWQRQFDENFADFYRGALAKTQGHCIQRCIDDGLLEYEPDSHLKLTESGKAFVRQISTCFDKHFPSK